MRQPSRWIVLGAVTICVAPGVYADDAAAGNPASRWRPSLSIAFDLYEDTARGRIDSTIDFSAEGDKSKTLVLFRVGAELMTPTYDRLWGDPRLFAYAGAQLMPDQTKIVTSAGEPVNNESPELDIANGGALLRGEGSEIKQDFLNESWYMGIGVAYQVPFAGIDILFKPKFEYMGERLQIRGRIVEAFEQLPRTRPRTFDVIRVDESEEQTFHSVGPGLEVEFVLDSTGRLAVSLFWDIRVLWNVGDRDVAFGDEAGVGTFAFRRQRSSVRGGAGIRLAWQGALWD